jgi:hypothetical protein
MTASRRRPGSAARRAAVEGCAVAPPGKAASTRDADAHAADDRPRADPHDPRSRGGVAQPLDVAAAEQREAADLDAHTSGGTTTLTPPMSPTLVTRTSPGGSVASVRSRSTPPMRVTTVVLGPSATGPERRTPPMGLTTTLGSSDTTALVGSFMAGSGAARPPPGIGAEVDAG